MEFPPLNKVNISRAPLSKKRKEPQVASNNKIDTHTQTLIKIQINIKIIRSGQKGKQRKSWMINKHDGKPRPLKKTKNNQIPYLKNNWHVWHLTNVKQGDKKSSPSNSYSIRKNIIEAFCSKK